MIGQTEHIRWIRGFTVSPFGECVSRRHSWFGHNFAFFSNHQQDTIRIEYDIPLCAHPNVHGRICDFMQCCVLLDSMSIGCFCVLFGSVHCWCREPDQVFRAWIGGNDDRTLQRCDRIAWESESVNVCDSIEFFGFLFHSILLGHRFMHNLALVMNFVVLIMIMCWSSCVCVALYLIERVKFDSVVHS